MTVMAAEGAAGAVERGSIRKVPAKRAQGQVVSRSDRRVYDTYGTRTRARQRTATRQPRTAGAPVTYSVGGNRGMGGGPGGYQGVILAEFLIAVLVVAFMPLAAGPPSDGKAGPSPYRVNDIEQLAAIGVVYFLLAMLSGGRHGKATAWFGGLILLGIGFKKMMSGQFSAAVSGLGGQPAPTEAGNFPGASNPAANIGENAGSGPPPSGGGGGHDTEQ